MTRTTAVKQAVEQQGRVSERLKVDAVGDETKDLRHQPSGTDSLVLL